MARWMLVCTIPLLGGCALLFPGKAKVISRTENGGTVEQFTGMDPTGAWRKAQQLMGEHCGSTGYTVVETKGRQSTYVCRSLDTPAGPACEPAGPAYEPPADCVPNGGRVKSIEMNRCCSGYARTVPYEDLYECY